MLERAADPLTPNGGDVFEAALKAGLRSDPRVTISEWADKHRVLVRRASSEAGQWRTSRTPYLREIMDVLTDESPVEFAALMKGVQIGGSETMINWIGWTIAVSPCPFLYAMPSLELARDFSRQRIAPMITASAALDGLVAERRSRDSDNTILVKQFEGGTLRLVGANSAAGFRSMPAKRVVLDDLDGFPDQVEEEGDPVSLAVRRTTSFARHKIAFVSTPTIEGRSKIARQFELGDQRYFHVPCPACSAAQVFQWPRFKWEEGDPASVRMACSECGVLSPEHAWKTRMVEGQWVPKEPERSSRFRSYHLPALYSPLGMKSWESIVRDFLAAKGNPESLKAFVNTILAETWKERGDAPDWKRLYERRERYQVGTVPQGGLALTAGVDVQKDRLELEVVAWGRGRESWSVDYRVLPGDPGTPAPWLLLNQILGHEYPHDGGARLRIRALGIDTGYETQHVYNWCRLQPLGVVFALKGTDGGSSIVEQPKAVEVSSAGKRLRRGLRVWPVAGNVAKAELYGWLRAAAPTHPGESFPEGYCHFPEYAAEYFEQLTAEQVVVRIVRTYRRYQWEKTRERNEALDCRVYARAAAAIVGLDRMTPDQWTELEKSLKPETPAKAPPPQRRDGGRGGYLDRWRGDR